MKKNSNPIPFSLECHIQSFDGKYAILKNGDPEIGTIRWPIHHLPEKIQIGEKITLKITGTDMKNDEEYLIKRKLLEKIINCST